MAKSSLLKRYCDGNHEQVWEELISLGEKVWDESILSEAKAVAEETMRRVRTNIDLLIPRLKGIGYRFTLFSPHTAPEAQASELITDFERRFKTFVPLSLRAFYEIVGTVDFRGTHPDWEGLHDPLQIYGINVTQEDAESCCGPITKIYLCPCPLLKEGFSAVGPLYLVPGKAADSLVSFEDGPLPFTFVQYLRNFFRWGGFAGCVCSEEEFEHNKEWVQRPPTHQEVLPSGLVSF